MDFIFECEVNMKCSSCDRQAIITRKQAGVSLCSKHFIDYFERTVYETIASTRMIKEHDRIAVAVSGGKDSTALLFSLHKILTGRDVKMVAITVDEGIRGYRDDTIRAARDIAGKLNVEHHIVSFREEYGCSLDQMVVGKNVAPCTFCGVFRKHALNRAAKRLGADEVATGHNLDDEAQTVMMNYLKGDYERLMRFRPSRIQKGLVPRIKPLRAMPEKEIALYCMVNGVFAESRECPYADLSLRADVRDMMNALESQFPGTKQSTVLGFEEIAKRERGMWTQMDLEECRVCGEPCVNGRCKACELLEQLGAVALPG